MQSTTYPTTQAHVTHARNGTVDLLRFLGAIAIVWFHLGLPYAEIFLSALPMFAMLSVSYGSGKSFPNRLRRFMVPWLFWFGDLRRRQDRRHSDRRIHSGA